MRGVLGVEVTDEGVWSTDLEIFETGAKIPAGQKKMNAVRNSNNSCFHAEKTTSVLLQKSHSFTENLHENSRSVSLFMMKSKSSDQDFQQGQLTEHEQEDEQRYDVFRCHVL